MITRDDLHRLITTLPDEALTTAERFLEKFQNWPPQPPAEAERMRRRERAGDAGGGGKIEHGHHTSHRSEGDTAIIETLRFHKGHALRIIERIRLQDHGQLIYSHEITGPNGKAEAREIAFDI